MKSFFNYDDDYPTCYSTHATLCIYLPDDGNPNAITDNLGVKPSRMQVKGETRKGKVKNWPTAWFLETSEQVRSNDARRHIDWLLEQVQDNSDYIKQLQDSGCEVHIFCFWESAYGHGGPMLDHDIVKRIADLGIGIYFDIYFAGDKINEIYNEILEGKNKPKIVASDPDTTSKG